MLIERNDSGGLVLSFAGRTGVTYRLISSTTLDPLPWWPSFANVIATNSTVRFPIPHSARQAFFAVEERTNPLHNLVLHVDRNSAAASWAASQRETDPTNSMRMEKIATNAVSIWLTGNEGDAYAYVKNYVDAATILGEVPVFTLYNIPHRDCGNFSSGGSDAEAYTNWVEMIGRAIDTNRSIVILEPDALANLDCAKMTISLQNERISLIRAAIGILKSNPNTWVYVDAGHSDWQPAATMIMRLGKVGITNADGFALNVSNFQRDRDLLAYGTGISKKLNDMHFVIDSSRNGRGPYRNPADPVQWCNPPSCAIGQVPKTQSGQPLVDAYLWIKNPAESDGDCRPGAPRAGAFWPQYALDLVEASEE